MKLHFLGDPFSQAEPERGGLGPAGSVSALARQKAGISLVLSRKLKKLSISLFGQVYGEETRTG